MIVYFLVMNSKRCSLFNLNQCDNSANVIYQKKNLFTERFNELLVGSS